MKRCMSCHSKKPDDQFPSPVSLTCNFCTPPSEFVYAADGAMQSRVNPLLDYRMDGFGTRASNAISKAIKELPTKRTNSIKNALLDNPHVPMFGKAVKAEPGKLDTLADALDGQVRYTVPPDDRPLIDKLHEATFGDSVGLQWIADKYALRMLLRKAHCFTLDETTSRLVADFSIAVAKDLESARRMAIPPFPTTWIDFDNTARLTRMKELGVKLTATASGETEAGAAVERVGWLIHPDTINGGFFATYVCEVSQGVTLAPLSYWWHTDPSQAMSPHLKGITDIADIDFMDRLSFGVKNSGVSPTDAVPAPTTMHVKQMWNTAKYPQQVKNLMIEIGGELRHVWGFLIALGAGQLGVDARYSDQPKPQRAPPVMKNGKLLLPIIHKVLHLHLAKRTTPDKVVVRMVTHHKLKWHEVRSHWRTYKNKDGTVRKRIPILSYERGDEKLGRVEKTYRVKR